MIEPDEALVLDLEAAFGRVLVESQRHVLAELRSTGTALVAAANDPGNVPHPTGLFDVELWAALVDTEVGPTLAKVLIDAASRAGLGYSFDLADPRMAAAVARHINGIESWGQEFRATIARTVERGMTEGWSIDTMAVELAENGSLTNARAVSIARTEAIAAANAGTVEGWRVLGFIAKKKWSCTHDDRTRDTHVEADGQEVPLDGVFTVGGFSADYPGDPSLPLEERVNCRCSMFSVEGPPAVPDVTTIAARARAGLYETFEIRHSKKDGKFLPKGASEGSRAPKSKAKAPAANGAIEHDENFPVKDGFRRVDTHAERKAIAETHGVVIPPGWRNVQVSIDPHAPGLRARGTDAKGRVQPRYSEEHRKSASAAKFARIKQLDQDVGALDTALSTDSRTNPTAGAVLVMRRMGLRPGSTEDTRADRAAYGATTLEARHLKFGDGTVTLDFDSKKGGHTKLTTSDPEVYATLKAHAAGKGPNDRVFDTSDERTNAYIGEHIPGYTNKDLRTYLATGLARTITAKMPAPATAAAAAKARKAIATTVSEALGNTPQEALKSYIAPEVWDAAGWAA